MVQNDLAAISDAPTRVTAHIAAMTEAGDWRGATLDRVRALIHEALPGVREEWKWARPSSPGVPVWSQGGLLCTGEVYRRAVKLTFPHGAALPDPAGLFNASLEGKTRRAIDLHEGELLDGPAFVQLMRAAADANAARTR